MNIVRIKVDNIYGKILDPIPEKVFKELREECSYISKQLAYSSRQYGYHPHPTYRFSKTMVFRVGLLSKVQGILRSHSILSHVEGNDEDEINTNPFPISDGWGLRDYQIGSVNDILKRKKTAHEIATGGGKTVIMGDAISKIGLKTTVLTNSTVLMHQTARLLKRMLNTDIGIVGDSVFDPKDVTVAMVQSLEGVYDKDNASPNRADKLALVESTKFLVVDECHRIAAKTIFDLSAGFKNARYAAFFTATMRRLDGKDLDLEAASGPIYYSVDMYDLVEAGWLVRPHVYYLKVPPRYISPKDSHLVTSKVYNTIRAFHIDEYQERTELIAKAARTLADAGHSTLVSVRHIDHGNRIKELLPTAVEIYAETYNRVPLFQKFREGEIPIVISTLCKEGIDIPRCSAVVIAHDTQDGQQLVGRALRLYPGKDKAIIVHLVDEHPIFRKHIKFNEKVFYKPQKIAMEHITEDDLPRIVQ